MSKRIIIKVPEILKERGLDAMDLMYGARLAINTAKRYATKEEAQKVEMIDLDTILAMCDFLEVEVGDLLQIEEQ